MQQQRRFHLASMVTRLVEDLLQCVGPDLEKIRNDDECSQLVLRVAHQWFELVTAVAIENQQPVNPLRSQAPHNVIQNRPRGLPS